MKQTAVEFLEEKVSEIIGRIPLTVEQEEALLEALEQAKEMEKQQIINAFGVGCQVESTRLIGYQEIAKQYYNKTFKSE